MTNKMTNRKALSIAIAVLNDCGTESGLNTILVDGVGYEAADVVAKLKSMVDALDTKAANTKRKPTAKQTENAALREKIVSFFTGYDGDALTCTEIGKSIPELNDMNNQRISALMRALVDDGVIQKDTIKGKSVFSLAVIDESGE